MKKLLLALGITVLATAVFVLFVLSVGFGASLDRERGLHLVQETPAGVIDTWRFAHHEVDFVTIVEKRGDGLVSWNRGFRCNNQDQMWESATDSETDYKEWFEVGSAWIANGIVYYDLNGNRETFFPFSYPVECNK